MIVYFPIGGRISINLKRNSIVLFYVISSRGIELLLDMFSSPLGIDCSGIKDQFCGLKLILKCL